MTFTKYKEKESDIHIGEIIEESVAIVAISEIWYSAE